MEKTYLFLQTLYFPYFTGFFKIANTSLSRKQNTNYAIIVSVSDTRKETKMTNTNLQVQTSEDLLTSLDLREKLVDRVEVLEKVKALMLIPQMECATINQVADFYEVENKIIQKVIERNNDELILDGMCVKTPSDFKILKPTKCRFKNLTQKNGKLIVQIDDNTTLEIPNRGIRCFPRRAILRMGMLLRDSKVAKEVRTQLLNIEEQTTPEQKVSEISKEEGYITSIVTNLLHNNTEKVLTSLTDYHSYMTRKVTEAEENSKLLSAEIEVNKPLVDFAEQVQNSENAITIDEMCRIMHDENMDMGRIRFYKWLRMKGFIMKKNTLPYQKYINSGWFKVCEYVYFRPNGVAATGTKPLITGKGQVELLKILRKEYPKMRKS